MHLPNYYNGYRTFTLFPYSYIRSLKESQNEGRKEMAAPWKWTLSFFSFGSKTYKQSGCKGWSPTVTPFKQKIPHWESKNIRESILDFTAHFGEINPDMPYLCRRGLSGPQKAVFAFIPSVRRGVMKKMLNLRFFAKKQVNFWVVYLLRRKPLIINMNVIVYRVLLQHLKYCE